MTKQERLVLVAGFLITLAFYAISWALTIDQIWNSVYDSANQAIRFNAVATGS